MTSEKQHNVNVVSRIETNNVNDNVRKAKKTEKQVDSMAMNIMRKLGAEDNWEYYCKTAWNLSEVTINKNLEVALKGKNPQRYFTWLCNRSMKNSKL